MVIIRTILLILWSLPALSIEHSECLSIPSSKKYINPDFDHPYPKIIQFSCDYKCNAFGKYEVITALHTKKITSLNAEAYGLICQGVQLKKKPWGYDYYKKKPFYVYQTKLKELKSWGHSHNISIDSKLSKPYMLNLKSGLKETGEAFIKAGAQEAPYAQDFTDAGEILIQINQDLPKNTELLDQWVEKVNSENELKFGVDYLVINFLKVWAAWRM